MSDRNAVMRFLINNQRGGVPAFFPQNIRGDTHKAFVRSFVSLFGGKFRFVFLLFP